MRLPDTVFTYCISVLGSYCRILIEPLFDLVLSVAALYEKLVKSRVDLCDKLGVALLRYDAVLLCVKSLDSGIREVGICGY